MSPDIVPVRLDSVWNGRDKISRLCFSPQVFSPDTRNPRLIRCLQRFHRNQKRGYARRNVTMTDVKAKSPSFSRRKLSAVVRKAITSYYTAQEQQEIALAAKREGISMSSFVATASLAEARRGNRKL